MLGNYSFIIDSLLAGCALPGTFGELKSDLELLKADSVGAIITLTEEPLDQAVIREVGFEYLHVPIIDFTPPSIAQMTEIVGFIDRIAATKKATVIHCRAGIGRTGTMLAAYLIHQGSSASDAVEKVRTLRPGSIETSGQITSLYLWEKAVAESHGQD